MIESLQIGPINYTVKQIDDLHNVVDNNRKQWLHGQILHAEAVIQVSNDQAADVKICTLWHEAIHGILNAAGIDDHPEQTVVALGYGIVRLIRDNPALIAMTVGTAAEVPASDNGQQHPTEHTTPR
jgi:hypothetical protein